MSDLEQLFQTTASYDEDRHPVGPDVAGTVSRAAVSRRRGRLALLAVPSVFAVTAAIALVPALLRGDGSGQPAPVAGGFGDVPAEFVGIQNGHAGRYDSSTGERIEDLGAATAVAGVPGTTWVAQTKGCSSTLAASGGVGRRILTIGRVRSIAVSPDGTKLAYSLEEEAPDAASGACGPADLVVEDLSTSTSTRWNGSDETGSIDAISWSASGREVAFQTVACCDATTVVHTVSVTDPAAPPGDIAALPVPVRDSEDCRFQFPAHALDSLMLVRTCGNDEPAAIEVLPDGALGEAFPLPDRPVSLSAADRQLLVAVGGSDTDGALLYVDRKGHTRQLGRGITGATWVTGQSAVDAAPSAEAAPQPSTQPVPEATADASPPSGTCTYSPRATPAPARDVAPPSAEASDLPTTATIVTNRGEIRLTLLGDVAPCTVHNLAHLARAGFYDKTQCHRLTTQGIYVVQCGDPTGKGDGGPGYVFRDENLAGATYAKGTVAMANSGPGTNGSQFFFAYDDFPLDPNYTPFARITAGLDVLLEVAGGGSEPAVDGRPVKPLEILSIRLGS